MSSRRAFLRRCGAAAGLSVAVPLAGCDALPAGDGAGAAPRVDAVPAGVTAAVRLDAAALLESRVGLDPRRVDEVLAVGTDSPAGAALAWTDYDREEVTDALGLSGSGMPAPGDAVLYDPGGGTRIAALGDGRVAVGASDPVERLLTRQAGESPPLGEDHPLRTAYDGTRDGPLRLGVVPPESLLPDPDTSDSPLAVTAASVRYAHASLYREDGLIFEAVGECDDVDRADRLRAQVEAGVTIAGNRLDERNLAVEDRVRRLLDATSVSRDRRTVTVRNTEGELVVAGLVAVLGTFVLGPGAAPGVGGGPSETAPQVSWGFAYDAGTGRLTVTHEGGDLVRADRLRLVGEGVPTGTWTTLGGETGAGRDGRPVVTAGDSLTVDADPGTVRVVWDPADSDASATVGRYDVPA